MAGRRKFYFTVGIRDPLDANSVSMPGAGVTALVYPGSSPISGAISGGGPYTVPVAHPGELRVGDVTAFVKLSTGELLANGAHVVQAITEVSVTGSWTLTLAGIAVGDVISNPTNYAVIGAAAAEEVDGPFAAPVGGSMTPQTIEDTGLITGYFAHPADGSELRDVDIYVSGGGLNPGIFVRNVPYGGNVQVVDFDGATKASAANVTLDDDTGIVELTGTGPIQKFFKARPGRRLHIWTGAATGAITLSTTAAPGSDDWILGPTGASSVSLKQHRVYCLIGVVKSGFNVWALDEALSDTDLDDGVNVITAGATAGSVLYCFASGGTGQWVAASAIGSVAAGTYATVVSDPDTSWYRDSVGVKKYQIRPVVGGFTPVDRIFRLPDGPAAADEIMTVAGNLQTVTSEKRVHDDKLLVVDPVDTTRRTRIDSGSVSSGQTRVLTMVDRNMNIASLAAGRVIHLALEMVSSPTALHDNLTNQLGIVNGIYLVRPVYDIRLRRVAVDSISQGSIASIAGTLQLYRHTALPTLATVPPAAATPMLTTAINLATSVVTAGGRDTVLDVTSFAVDTVPAGQYMFLAAATALTNPSTHLRLTFVIEYEIV